FVPVLRRDRGGEFFFSSRRRHTRWPRDWSSDVCSSDLDPRFAPRSACPPARNAAPTDPGNGSRGARSPRPPSPRPRPESRGSEEIGRASCRERGEITVDGRSLKRKKRTMIRVIKYITSD